MSSYVNQSSSVSLYWIARKVTHLEDLNLLDIVYLETINNTKNVSAPAPLTAARTISH